MAPNDPLSKNPSHEQIWLLLPWFVNGSLEAAERHQVQAHLRHCPLCGEEVLKIKTIAQRIAQSPMPEFSPQASFARLRDSLGQQQANQKTPARSPSWGERIRQIFEHRPGFVHVAFALILLLLVLPLGVRQWNAWMEPQFYTLADRDQKATPVEGDFKIVFDDALEREKIDALLRSVKGERLAGPDSAGVYVIRLTDSDHSAAAIEASILRLRKQPGVVFVEPIRRP